MKILLDENLSYELRHSLMEHEVFTVRYLGWGGLKNGALLATAEDAGMEVFVTGDRNLSSQQKLAARRMAIVVLSAHNWPIIRNHVQAIARAVSTATSGSFQFVQCGEFRKR